MLAPALEVAEGKEWECEDTDPPAVALPVRPCVPVKVGVVLPVVPEVPVKDGSVLVVSPSTVNVVDEVATLFEP